MAAFANKSALRAGIKSWLSESNISDAAVDIAIALAEAEINEELRLLDGEATTSLTISGGTVAVPSGFRGVVKANLSTSPVTPVTLTDPDDLNDRLRFSGSGKPLYMAIEGNGDLLPIFRFAPSPDAAYTLNLTYTRTWALVEDDDTNKVLEEHPSCYLYGALVHGRLKLQSPSRLPDMVNMFDRAMDKAGKDDRRTRRGRMRYFKSSPYSTSRGWGRC